jgi:hypothetical protein
VDEESERRANGPPGAPHFPGPSSAPAGLQKLSVTSLKKKCTRGPPAPALGQSDKAIDYNAFDIKIMQIICDHIRKS